MTVFLVLYLCITAFVALACAAGNMLKAGFTSDVGAAYLSVLCALVSVAGFGLAVYTTWKAFQ